MSTSQFSSPSRDCLGSKHCNTRRNADSSGVPCGNSRKSLKKSTTPP
jgi:hypothetical protein